MVYIFNNKFDFNSKYLDKTKLIERFFLLNLSKKFNIYLILLLIILCIKNLYFVDYQSLSKKYLVEENYYKKTNKNLLKINIVRDDNFANYKLCGFIPNPCSIDLESLNNLNYEKRFIFHEYNFK